MVALAAHSPPYTGDNNLAQLGNATDMTDIEFWDLENDGENARRMMADAMDRLGLSQERLGSLLTPAVGQTQVSKWLTGTRVPRGPRREQIAKILDLPLKPRVKEGSESVTIRPIEGGVDRATAVTELLAIRSQIDSLIARI